MDKETPSAKVKTKTSTTLYCETSRFGHVMISAQCHKHMESKRTMISSGCALFLGTFVLMLALSRGDTEVSCVFMESCILPCSSQNDTDVFVHWTVTAGDLPVHSYYDSQDQLAHQDQRFRGRTSLFKDQISRGNASLQLTGVEVQDQGRYQCLTRTIGGDMFSFINLTVDAPVGKVDLQQVENSITCSSEGIYPEPELTWSTSPPSYVTFKSKTEVQRTEQLLYNISSSLILSDTDLNFICSISTRSNRRRATLFKPTSISGCCYGTTIPCTASNTSLTGFSLTWRFKHSQIILTQTRADVPCTVSEEWRQQVKGVSESGSLLLQDLSSYHEGTYTCELRDAEETLITSTFLRIGSSINIRAIIGLVVAAVVVAAVVVLLVLHHKRRQGQQENKRESNNDETQMKTKLLKEAKIVMCDVSKVSSSEKLQRKICKVKMGLH